MTATPRHDINAFLAAGELDPSFAAWPGRSFMDRVKIGSAALREALIVEVVRRTRGKECPAIPRDLNLRQLARQKFCPMVEGLFPRSEQTVVLSMLESSVVFLTPATIVSVLQGMPWLGTAWDLANLYLTGFAGDLLAPDASRLLGLSTGTTCYVSTAYFTPRSRFEEYLVHEAAHVFHNCKRETLGLPFSRRQEWLLGIDYSRRETFAYSSEAYSRIVELGRSRTHRQELLAELALEPLPGDIRVDGQEYLDILGDALAVRNGWKRILARCAPSKVAGIPIEDRMSMDRAAKDLHRSKLLMADPFKRSLIT